MRNKIEHVSGSMLNMFDYNKRDFIERYILGIEFLGNENTEFGKDYEDILAETKYKNMKRQIEINEIFEGYRILGYVDFGDNEKRIEIKTKNGRWTEKQIRKSRQFRIYNYYKGDKKLILHQYNKKTNEERLEDISFDDEYFIYDLYCKIKEVEEFLDKYGVCLVRY